MLVAVTAHTTVLGGAERYLTRLYSGLSGRGDTAHLVGSLPGWEATGLPATNIGLSPKWGRATVARGLRGLPAERARARRVVAALGPDVVHVQFKREQLGLSGPLSRAAPVVWTEHGRFPADRRAHQALATAYRLAARRAAAIICVSEQVADDVDAAVRGACPVMVIENAVDTAALRPPADDERRTARAALGLADSDGPVLLWIGRLNGSKRPELALQAGRHWPGVTLIVGTGPEHATLESGLQPGDRTVRLLGHLDDPAAAYRAADVLLFTSTGAGEGFPTTLLEAAAHGIPLVANEGSGMERMLRSAGGALAPDEPAALAEAAETAMRASAGAVARRWAIEHDLESWLDRHQAVLRQAAG